MPFPSYSGSERESEDNERVITDICSAIRRVQNGGMIPNSVISAQAILDERVIAGRKVLVDDGMSPEAACQQIPDGERLVGTKAVQAYLASYVGKGEKFIRILAGEDEGLQERNPTYKAYVKDGIYLDYVKQILLPKAIAADKNRIPEGQVRHVAAHGRASDIPAQFQGVSL